MKEFIISSKIVSKYRKERLIEDTKIEPNTGTMKDLIEFRESQLTSCINIRKPKLTMTLLRLLVVTGDKLDSLIKTEDVTMGCDKVRLVNNNFNSNTVL
jgi:hypothetical protein